MERAKRDVSWRAFEPLRAVEEMHRLDRFLDLSDWTLFVADALFGMKRAWRKEFLDKTKFSCYTQEHFSSPPLGLEVQLVAQEESNEIKNF